MGMFDEVEVDLDWLKDNLSVGTEHTVDEIIEDLLRDKNNLPFQTKNLDNALARYQIDSNGKLSLKLTQSWYKVNEMIDPETYTGDIQIVTSLGRYTLNYGWLDICIKYENGRPTSVTLLEYQPSLRSEYLKYRKSRQD